MEDKINHPIVKGLVPAIIYWFSKASANEIASLIAAVLASICSVLFITEWLYKRVYKPFAVQKGWIRGPHGFLDSTDNMELHQEEKRHERK